MAAGEPRLRAWLPVAAGAACLIAALAFAVSTVRRSGNHRETSTAAASNEQAASSVETTVPMSPPAPLVAAAASSSESQLAVATPRAPAAVAEPTEGRSHASPAPTARTDSKQRGSAQAPKSQPAAASRKSVPPAVATSAAKTTPEHEKSSDSRERVESPKLRRGAPPRTAALTMSDFENETAAEAAGSSPRATVAQANPNHGAQQTEQGYLSLDSAPWSDVFLGTDRLGTTPLIRVPLPPGKYLLTLRNPELGVSTSYAVEIQAGKTLSRLVGWEHR
jgi:hypothetical protein